MFFFSLEAQNIRKNVEIIHNKNNVNIIIFIDNFVMNLVCNFYSAFFNKNYIERSLRLSELTP